MTEVTIQEWGLELSAPNPLSQPCRHDVQCVWRTCAPLGCYCSYHTGTKAIKYSVNIVLVFFQVAFFLLFSVLSFSEWLEVFLLHLMCVIRLSWKALRLVTKISSESCHNILKHATYQENWIIISLHTIMLSPSLELSLVTWCGTHFFFPSFSFFVLHFVLLYSNTTTPTCFLCQIDVKCGTCDHPRFSMGRKSSWKLRGNVDICGRCW